MKQLYTTAAVLALGAGVALAQAQQPAQGQAQQPQQAQPGQAQQPQQAQPGQAQPGQPAAKKQPQAKSQPEFEAFQQLNDPNLAPEQKISQSEEFLQKYPETELKLYVYRKLLEAYQQKNDFNKMRESGEKVLELDPGEPVTLILLASAIPERTRETDFDRDQKLSQAEDYAKRALSAIDKLEKPDSGIPDAQWDLIRNDARAQSHAALALIALNRKQYPAAEESFRRALSLQNQKDPVVFWRLGLTYQFQRKFEQARDAYKQSLAAGGVKVPGQGGALRDVAQESLNHVEDLMKKQAGGEGATPAPAPGTTPPAPAPAPAPRP